jgi:hypothetical protein
MSTNYLLNQGTSSLMAQHDKAATENALFSYCGTLETLK